MFVYPALFGVNSLESCTLWAEVASSFRVTCAQDCHLSAGITSRRLPASLHVHTKSGVNRKGRLWLGSVPAPVSALLRLICFTFHATLSSSCSSFPLSFNLPPSQLTRASLLIGKLWQTIQTWREFISCSSHDLPGCHSLDTSLCTLYSQFPILDC